MKLGRRESLIKGLRENEGVKKRKNLRRKMGAKSAIHVAAKARIVATCTITFRRFNEPEIQRMRYSWHPPVGQT